MARTGSIISTCGVADPGGESGREGSRHRQALGRQARAAACACKGRAVLKLSSAQLSSRGEQCSSKGAHLEAGGIIVHVVDRSIPAPARQCRQHQSRPYPDTTSAGHSNRGGQAVGQSAVSGCGHAPCPLAHRTDRTGTS